MSLIEDINDTDDSEIQIIKRNKNYIVAALLMIHIPPNTRTEKLEKEFWRGIDSEKKVGASNDYYFYFIQIMRIFAHKSHHLHEKFKDKFEDFIKGMIGEIKEDEKLTKYFIYLMRYILSIESRNDLLYKFNKMEEIKNYNPPKFKKSG